MANANDRINNALDIIRAIAGEDERLFVESKLNQQNRQQFGDDLHIGGNRGGFIFKSNDETHRRNIVRAIVLTQLATGKLNNQGTQAQLTNLLTLNTGRLEKELLSLFPFKPFRGRFAKRQDWNPALFTDPKNHNPGNYMYLVHTIMGDSSKVAEVMTVNPAQGELEKFELLRKKYESFAVVDTKNPIKTHLKVRFYEQYLDDPNIIKSNIISSTVISNLKHATYYPFGFIMRVPPECIYITSPRDVGVANRTNNIINELKDKQRLAEDTIKSPQEILALTNQANNDNGYNEIVVIGTSPEGKQVEVNGIFVKTDGKGNIYMRNGAISKDVGEPYVNKAIQEMIIKSSKRHNIPIIPIPDTSGLTSTTPWPF